MSTHEERCPHCRAKAGLDGAQQLPVEPIAVPEPPSAARLFRIHYPDGHTRDYTLHPSGQLTFAHSGQLLTTSLDFGFMAETSWAGAHIEWDPQPLAEPEFVPAAVVVQDAIPLPTP